jgi:hypothetical protein
MASAAPISSTSTPVSRIRGGDFGPFGPACRRAPIINGTTRTNNNSCTPASAPKNAPVTSRCAPARRSASRSPVTAANGSPERPGVTEAGLPANSRSGAGRPSAASTVGARSTSCRYPSRPVPAEVSQPPCQPPGPSAIATCSRLVGSVSDSPVTTTRERSGRAARTFASVASAFATAFWRVSPTPVTVPRSTTLSTQDDSSSRASAGSAGSYRSTRPNGRAAATAAPDPTATVHRTDSASAPGIAPYGWRSWLARTTPRCWGRFAPMPSGRSSCGASCGQSPVIRWVSQEE